MNHVKPPQGPAAGRKEGRINGVFSNTILFRRSEGRA